MLRALKHGTNLEGFQLKSSLEYDALIRFDERKKKTKEKLRRKVKGLST